MTRWQLWVSWGFLVGIPGSLVAAAVWFNIRHKEDE